MNIKKGDKVISKGDKVISKAGNVGVCCGKSFPCMGRDCIYVKWDKRSFGEGSTYVDMVTIVR